MTPERERQIRDGAKQYARVKGTEVVELLSELDQKRQELDVLVSVVASIAANIAVRINGRIIWKTNTEVPRYKVDTMTFDTAEQAVRAALSAQPAEQKGAST